MRLLSRKGQVSPFNNAKAVLTAQVIGALAWLATVSVLASSMEAAHFSQFLYLFALAAGLEALSDAGLRFTVVTRLSGASDAKGRSQVLFNAIFAKLLLSVLAAIFIVMLVTVGLIRVESRLEIFLTIAVLVTLPSTNPLVWVLRSVNMQWYEGIVLVIYRLALLSTVLLVSPAFLCTNCLLAIMTAANIIFFFLIVLPALQAFGEIEVTELGQTFARSWRLVRESLGLGMSLLFSQLSARFWVLLLGYYALSLELVAVSTSQMIIQSVLMLGVAVGSSYLPYLGATITSDFVSFQKVARSIILLGLAVGTAFGIGVNFSASLIMVELFSQTDEKATEVLKLMSFLSPIILLSFIVRFVLSSTEKSGAEFKANLYGIAPAVLVSPFVLQWRGVTYVLLLYILGESVTLAAKLIAVRKEVGIQARDLLSTFAVTGTIFAIYMISIESRVPSEDTSLISDLTTTIVLTLGVLIVYAGAYYKYFKPLWKLSKADDCS